MKINKYWVLVIIGAVVIGLAYYFTLATPTNVEETPAELQGLQMEMEDIELNDSEKEFGTLDEDIEKL